MKRILLLLLAAVAVAASAQTHGRDSVRTTDDGYYFAQRRSVQTAGTGHLFNAGKSLQKSAIMDGASWLLAVGAGVAFSGEVLDERSASNAAGFALGAAAIVCRIASISFKSKAGAELKLMPGGVAVRF